MKPKNFVKTACASLLCTTIFAFASCGSGEKQTENKTSAQTGEIYEWRIYTLAGEGNELDNFYETTLIPAYNRQGVSIGAFTAYKPDENQERQRYFLFVYPDIGAFHKLKNEIRTDKTFRKQAQQFYDSSAVKPVYSNFESFLCEAFDKIPKLRKPAGDRTLFEFRIYHSPNEEANQRKIKMFNVDEIDIFDKTGINSFCYGEVLAGSRMPALIYLTWYKDEETRNSAWNTFVNHDEWKRIKSLPEYANTATNNKSKLLVPMPYSQY